MSSYTLPASTVIVCQDKRLLSPDCLWASESSYSQADPAAAIVPDADYLLRLEAGGTPEDTAITIAVQVSQGGHPGRGTESGAYCWAPSSDDTWRGWEPPISIVGFERVEYSSSTVSASYTQPHILGRPGGRTLLAYRLSESAGDLGIAVRILEPGETAWSARQLIHDQSATGLAVSWPCLVSAGRFVLLLHWVESADSSSWHIRVHVSRDEGDTWSMLRAYATRDTDIDDTTYSPERLRAAYAEGQLLVVAHLTAPAATFNDILRQYASADLGARLVTVETWLGDVADAAGGFPEVLALTDGFGVLYVQPDASTAVEGRRVGSAFQPLSQSARYIYGEWDAQIADKPGAIITDADLCACVDDAGVVWAFFRYADAITTHRCGVVISGDGLRTFEPVGVDPTDATDDAQTGCWWMGSTVGSAADHYPEDFACTFSRGRVLLAARHHATTATTDRSLEVYALGGYTSVALPPTRRALRVGDRAHWWSTYVPLERPDDLGSVYTTSSTATGAGALTSAGRLEISTGFAAGTHFYYQSDGTTGDLACIVEWACEVVASAGDLALQEAGVTVRLSDGSTHGVEVGLHLTRTAMRVRDAVAGATLVELTGLPPVRAYRMALFSDGTNRRCQLWYREHEALDEDRAWILAVSTTTLSDNGGSAGSVVRWGCISATTNTTLSWMHGPNWSIADVSSGAQPVGTMDRWDEWDSTAAPTGLQGRSLSTAYTYVGSGYTLRATQGPAGEGDAFTLQPAFGYPIERLWASHARSPRVRWRSADEAEQQIALRLHPTFSSTTSGAAASYYGLVVQGANWRTGSLQRYTGGAWSSVATLDLGDLGSLSYTRVGNVVKPSGNSGGTYFFEGELSGATWSSSSGIQRRILWNTEGKWNAGWGGPSVELILDGVTALDGTSGTGRIWTTRGAWVWPASSAAGYRLVIDAQSTADGYIELGTMLLGPALVLSARPDWGWMDEVEGGARRRRRSDGADLVVAEAPPYRRLQLAWTDGVDETQAWGDSPDYLAFSAGVAASGARSAMVRSLRSLVWDRDGEQIAVLPRMVAADTATMLRREQILVGTLTSSARLEAVLGEELSTQVNRLAAFAFDESV